MIGTRSPGEAGRFRVSWDQIVPGIGIYQSTVTASLTIPPEQDLVIVDATSAPVVVTLPPAARAYRAVTVKKVDGSANSVTIDGDGSETIDGAATLAWTTQYAAYTVVSDGSDWHIV